MSFWRINIFSAFFLLAFAVVLVRLFQIQVLDHSRYLAAAENQHWGETAIPAARGRILSADGSPLVDNETVYLLYAEPPEIDNAEEVAEAIVDLVTTVGSSAESAESLGCPVSNTEIGEEEIPEQGRFLCRSAIEERLEYERQWVALAHKLPAKVKEQIEALEIGGLGFEEESKRFYPEGTLAAHLLGFVGSDQYGQDKGYYGLEGYYDGSLRGTPGLILEERDALGRPIPVAEYQKISPQDGADLFLTINRESQFLIEKHLQAGVERFAAESGTAIMMEPETGAILAMANFPTFDPSDLKSENQKSRVRDQGEEEEQPLEGEEEEDKDYKRNLAIAATYEPGSVLKSLSMSAAIDAGVVEPTTKYNCQGPLRIGGYTIRTWDNKYHGEETMIEVLQHSCNIGAAWAAGQLGGGKLREYFLKFGLGELLGIDLEGEDTGTVKNRREWREIDTATNAFGQGISLTPLQLITAFSAIVSDGKLMKPYVVSEIHDRGKVLEFGPRKVAQVISPESSEIMKGMLTAAAEAGEAKFFVLKNYHVAGKTGTAQIPVGGHYDPHLTNATFIGFLPGYPEFVLLVKLEKPSTSVYAAETAVPLWMEIVEDLIAYYGFSPDR